MTKRTKTAPTVVFSSRLYVNSHGKTPSGRGQWAFARQEEARQSPPPTLIWANGTLTYAKAYAAELARELFPSEREVVLEVMP